MKKNNLHEILELAYGEKPKTLLVCEPMPGLSDSNILLCTIVMQSPDHVVKMVEKEKQLIYAWEDDPSKVKPQWKLLGIEVCCDKNCFFEGIVIAYYTHISAITHLV